MKAAAPQTGSIPMNFQCGSDMHGRCSYSRRVSQLVAQHAWVIRLVAQVATSRILCHVTSEIEVIYLPSDSQDSVTTLLVCAFRVWTAISESASHRLILKSCKHGIRALLQGLHDAQLTIFVRSCCMCKRVGAELLLGWLEEAVYRTVARRPLSQSERAPFSGPDRCSALKVGGVRVGEQCLGCWVVEMRHCCSLRAYL
jgi:hypothetical protein